MSESSALSTTDPSLQSWIPVASDSDFPVQNLPFGVFSVGTGLPRIGVAIGDRVLNCDAVAESGFFDDVVDREILQAPTLNPFFAAGRETWRAVRARVSDLLREGGDSAFRERAHERDAIVRMAEARMTLPAEVGDYVDFYSSLQHATNLGKIFRPDGEPLMPNWRWMPIAYHGRAGTLVVDGTPVHRPSGQRRPPNADAPKFGPSARLDIELEVGFFTGPGNAIGTPIPIAQASEHVYGLVLVNDWSARDIQAWEYQPLGPFLGKSFATTVSPWVVSLEALEPFRVAGPVQEPAPLPYLNSGGAWNYDVHLTVELRTRQMREKNLGAEVVTRTNFREMYWNVAQQLAHATANGAATRPGDLFASGTISGDRPDSLGSFIEMTWNGQRPIVLPTGERRAFLEDGDDVTLRGWCERPGARRIGFGTARGRIVAQ
jgi:fumarylacetoacetase